MANAKQDLMLEILKQIQCDLSFLKKDTQGLKQGQVRTREDIDSSAGHVISLEKSILDLDGCVQRFEKRLDLVDA